MSRSNRIQKNQIATLEETLNRSRTQNQEGKFIPPLEQVNNIQAINPLQTPAQFKNLFSRILDNIDIDAEKLIKVAFVLNDLFKNPLSDILNRIDIDVYQLVKVALVLDDLFKNQPLSRYLDKFNIDGDQLMNTALLLDNLSGETSNNEELNNDIHIRLEL